MFDPRPSAINVSAFPVSLNRSIAEQRSRVARAVRVACVFALREREECVRARKKRNAHDYTCATFPRSGTVIIIWTGSKAAAFDVEAVARWVNRATMSSPRDLLARDPT